MNIFVVPATYNEKGNIGRLITILEEEVFPKIKNHTVHILVLDDSSTDGTANEVKTYMKKYKNLDINEGSRKGLGAAYLRGMTYAIEKLHADVLIEMDADLQHDPHSIPAFIETINKGYDLVIGTRYSKGGSMPDNWPLQRKMFSVGGNLLVRLITGRFDIHDWTGGFRAIKKEVFLKEREKVRTFQGYTFQVAFLYKAILDGYKVSEIPIHFKDRTLGHSKIAPLAYIINLLIYVTRERMREVLTGSFGKFLVVGGIGFIINFLVLKVLSESFYWNHSLANLIGAALAILSNYNLNNIWTFSHARISSFEIYIWKMFQFYLTSAFGVIFIQTATIFLGDHFIGEGHIRFILPIRYYYIYFVVGTGLLLIWNFAIYSRVIWKKPRQ